jgi:predicted dehydrogenase
VKDVSLEPDHWYLWPNQGTRIAGNACHWFDLGVYLMGARALPVSVTVTPAVSSAPESFDEERVVSVCFEDGSLLSVLLTGRGDDIRGVQEFVEARRGRLTLTLDDLWKMTVRRDGVTRRDRTPWRDKGHRRMFEEALERLGSARPSAYPLRDLVLVSATQIAATRLVEDGKTSVELGGMVRDFFGQAGLASQSSRQRHRPEQLVRRPVD